MRLNAHPCASFLALAMATLALFSAKSVTATSDDKNTDQLNGSKCTDQPGTYKCGSGSTLYVCIFNIWMFASNCPDGTSCYGGSCIFTSDALASENAAQNGQPLPTAGSDSGNTSVTSISSTSASGYTSGSGNTNTGQNNSDSITDSYTSCGPDNANCQSATSASSDLGSLDNENSDSGNETDSNTLSKTESGDGVSGVVNISTIDCDSADFDKKSSNAIHGIPRSIYNICLPIALSIFIAAFASGAI
ncbi:hypothetical protein GGI25_006408 [Coemansia spiralis]|uniref:Uncharacterized protein n=1 Tax=Coemansia spiralis TaxID=417178 RepID=A0A9W8KV66_9FUNG|nr:hypothetical protein GGI25_006408 [Coemansia spiralis]